MESRSKFGSWVQKIQALQLDDDMIRHMCSTPTTSQPYRGTNIMDEIDVIVGIHLRRDEQRTRSLPSKDPICYVPLSEPNANIQITAIGYSRSTSCVAKIVSQSLIIFIMLKYTQQNHCYLNQTNQSNNLPWECLLYIHMKSSNLVNLNLISRGQQKQTEAWKC